MADSKITALTSISTSTDPAVDPLVIVDVSDTSMAATGTTKKVTLNQLLGASGTATLASATISGDLTVRTTGLVVNSSGLGVGISPSAWNNTYNAIDIGANGSIAGRTGSNNTIDTASNGFRNSAGDWIYKIATSNLAARYQVDGSSGSHIWYNAPTGTSPNIIGWSTLMTLNSTGLGIGVSPIYKFHVKSDLSELFFRDNGTASDLVITSETGGVSALYFGDVADTVRGGIRYDSSVDTLALHGYNNVSRLIIDNVGNIGIGVTPAGTGGCLQLKSGVTFPATQVASSDANTLDDYEEGTWTGTLAGGTTNPTIPVTATGQYTKIGNQVFARILFSNIITTGASGAITVTGLPFANGSNRTIGSTLCDLIATFTGSPICWVGGAGTTLNFQASNSNGAASDLTHNAGTGRYFYSTIVYTV